MKSEKRSVKKQIKARIGLPKQIKKMGVRDKLREVQKFKPIRVDLVDRNEIRTGVKKSIKEPIIYDIKDYGEYVKPENVDYDVLIYISSFDRYEKLLRILEQLHSQETRYSFKIIVMNDGSVDKRYYYLKNKFPEIIYLKNKINGGQKLYWETTNKIYDEIKNYLVYAVIQIDDDFILCDGFIDTLIDRFFWLKEKNNAYMGIKYHLASFNEEGDISDNVFDWKKTPQTLDGGSLFDPEFLRLFDYKLHNYHVWGQLYNYVRQFGVMVHTLRESLAYHDGNFDSKMYPDGRINRKIHTKRFVNDKSGNII